MPRRGWIKTVSPRWVSVITVHRPAFVDIWQAGLGPWRRVEPGDLVLLKRRGSVEDIIGFGIVYCRMPAFSSSIWNRYGPATGASNQDEFEQEVAKRNSRRPVVDPVIGNIIIESLGFFPDRPFKLFQQSELQPGYYLGGPIEAATCEHLVHLLHAHAKILRFEEGPVKTIAAEPSDYSDSLHLHAWEDAVRVAYRGGCAVTAKKARDIPRVVAVKPFDLSGPYHVSNGILLDLNLATLHEEGLISFHLNGALVVSPDLALEDRELYREIAGKLLKVPTRPEDRLDPDLLQWRLENRYRR